MELFRHCVNLNRKWHITVKEEYYESGKKIMFSFGGADDADSDVRFGVGEE